MDALMIVLVVMLVAQIGGRLGDFTMRLAERTGRPTQVVGGVMLAQALLCALAIRLGIMLAARFTPEMHGLLLAIALMLVGFGMMGRPRRAASYGGFSRLGVTGTAAIGAGVILLADLSVMVVMAAAARSPLPWAALPGALAGTLGAILPPLTLGEREWRRLPLRAMRIAIGSVLILAGLVIGLSTKGLI
ncbi:hypothetical protein [Sphingomonas sp.]|uniref:hypothetical protein n=1 Tax=Sphingomonas sp. TaxID=28214 RepID=UPI0031E10E63